jgi:ketosteroid isomerase-like protein
MGNPDPKTWTISTVGREDIRKYADGFKTRLDVLYPGLSHTAEIQHVHVRGNNALAVARQHNVIPDKEKGKSTTEEFESVFLLKKNAKGEWKITGWLGGASWKREVTEQ